MKMKGSKIGKHLALVLRHKPESIGLKLDGYGWADVKKLVRKMGITEDVLIETVRNDDKQRYSFSEDGTRVRANQGHSIDVDLELREVEPPPHLYHGTAARFWESIRTGGLRPMSRKFVHISGDTSTAVKVGRRHGKPMVLIVLAKEMHDDGHKFYLSENRVWLTEFVPPKYITRINL